MHIVHTTSMEFKIERYITEIIYTDLVIFYLHSIRLNNPSQTFPLKFLLVTTIFTHKPKIQPIVAPYNNVSEKQTLPHNKFLKNPFSEINY